MKARERADKIEEILFQEFGELGPTLIFHSDFECLVSILLSAQTTDLSVNKVTPALFKRFRNPSDFAGASVEEIRPLDDKVNATSRRSGNSART